MEKADNAQGAIINNLRFRLVKLNRVPTKGYTLLELLLVLVVIAGISLMSINQYQRYREQTDIAAVKSDVLLIQQALNRYFHRQLCTGVSGTYQGNLIPAIVSDLGLSASYLQREPIVSVYSVKVKDSGFTTAKQKKIYVLEVSAVLDPSLSLQRQTWFEHVLQAGELKEGKLIWISLPNALALSPHRVFWAMSGEQQLFREMQNANNSEYCLR